MRPSNKTLQLCMKLCMKVQPHSSLDPPMEYNEDPTPLTNQGSLCSYEYYAVSD